jgi:DNA ligase-1
VQLAALAQASAALASVRGRIAKVRMLGALLRELAPDERETAVAWLSGVLAGGRLGLGPAAIHGLRGLPPAPQSRLTIVQTRARLDALKDMIGKGSAARRQAALAELFGEATAAEQDFLARLLLGELRQGALEGIMADAIAFAAGVPAAEVRRAVMLAGSVAPVAAAALAEGSEGLARFRLRLYEPVSPMLASPTEDTASAMAALGTAILEYKLDGARAQIHKGAEGVRVYSRSGRDVTFSLPEIAVRVEALAADSLILDAEVLAMHPNDSPRPFQDTMRRFGRRLGVEDAQAVLPLSLFCFDCLHADGVDLIDRTTEERHRVLADRLPGSLIVPRLVTADPDEARAFLQAALDKGHEGLMAKAPSAPYEAGSRGASWLKIKVAHTLDLVVLAAEWGSGRRRGWLSNLHLGARDEDGGFVMLGKTFKGLTDEMLAWQTERLSTLALDLDANNYVVNVKPELVVEIAFNELQASSRYAGGLALRFARVVRYREDKTAADADTIETARLIAVRQRRDSNPQQE